MSTVIYICQIDVPSSISFKDDGLSYILIHIFIISQSMAFDFFVTVYLLIVENGVNMKCHDMHVQVNNVLFNELKGKHDNSRVEVEWR